jgi:hypothetical protein
MNDPSHSSGDLSDELRALGENLRTVFQAAWDSDDRRRLQKEIEDGMEELASSLGAAAKEFSGSETGKQMKEDVREFGERLQTGEVESKIRQDLTTILRKVNEELGRAASSWSNRQPPGPESQA